ncbi:MAG TPA: sarcosine oxidase subunit delta [Stellaceae bacterium]|nr:sarcosine oxidase subunit delta [Stellaceae bacterium]
MSLLAEFDPRVFEAGSPTVWCPRCGLRPDREFRRLDSAPPAPTTDPFIDDADIWGEVLYRRPNANGLSYERWRHRCGSELETLHDAAAAAPLRFRPVEDPLLYEAAE